jgi:hypothetical protein
LPRSRKKGSSILVAYRTELTCKIIKIKSMPKDENRLPNDPKIIFYVIYNPPSNLPSAINDLPIDNNTIVLRDFNAQNTQCGTMTTIMVSLERYMLEDFIHTSPLLLMERKGDLHSNTLQ